MSIWTEAGDAAASILTNDSFEMKLAFNTDGGYLFFGVLILISALGILALFRALPFLDRHLERFIIVYSYLIIAWIIFSGVVQRFVLNGQPPWSSTIPPLLFMVMVWFGCSYNVKLRTHLSFNEFRSNMPRVMQMATLTLDAFLWFGFCVIAVTTTARVTANSAANFQIVLGTDDVLQWWFIITVPISFVLMAARVLENYLEDIRNFRTGAPLIQQSVIGGDV
ncbi:Tripartite ATP-independent periplasmic transporters, DctQ component [Roseovarius litorisediminis]|uniref:TRAP transporter small permease protein n=1 Tax=Roseovarius litorisediminis TaxID=1312363 RepID=A0A1Y5T2L7_9RHOB|nr:TRAP transporter small permease subunit [Roseovarius litorisediminis]SLN54462.1 Tripartite ATP-independent periplasmic transporters, DctQ component [Roseovarius litorisediminis]